MSEKTFDAALARDNLVARIREFTEKAGVRRVVLGVSGGKDSTVAAALCARALGAQNVYGIMLPDGVQKDISDSVRVCEALGINARTVNIGAIHAALRAAALEVCGEDVLPGSGALSERRRDHERKDL